MIGERDILAFRQGYYSLLVRLFWKEPPGELLLSLSDGITERIDATRNLHPLLAEGWEEVRRFLSETPSEHLTEAVADEYTSLFIGPYDPKVDPYESFYLTGRMWDRPLAGLRTFLKAIGIEKQDGYAEPEDFLAFELEVMRWLIGKQGVAADSEEEKRWLRHQADFLKQHLLVWAPTCGQDIEKAKAAHFYRGTAMILRGFLEMERNLFLEWGLDKIASLEEVRRLYGAIPMWKGPTFEMPSDEPETPVPAKNK
jgi:TorA maturation chaperone TorD